MKAPDKIYVPQHNIEAESIYELCEFVIGDSVEYIRKDALLEWAKTEKLKCSDETHPYAQFMNVVIDKLNSM